MKLDLITRLEELLQKDAAKVAADVRALQKEYQKVWTAEFEKARQEFDGATPSLAWITIPTTNITPGD